MASTCFGHLHVHLQEFLYVVSLPHVVLCHRCWGCGPAELVCSLVHWSHLYQDLKKIFLMGNFTIPDHITIPVGKPRKRWVAIVQRVTSHILGIWGWRHEQKTEKNGDILWGRPGPRRGCRTINGRKDLRSQFLTLIYIYITVKVREEIWVTRHCK